MPDPGEPLRVLIVDDEPLAIERLQLLLAKCEGVSLVGTAADGEGALRIAAAMKPDVLLLDIAMPEMDGIEVARRLAGSDVDPAIIFITAFDNFAVAAFDVAAVDYLMKPVETDRLARALERARFQLDNGKPERVHPTRYVEEFWVPDHNGLVRIAAGDIDKVTAERDYMRLHVGLRSWLIYRTIAKLEGELDPAYFIRVHRSVIIRRDKIAGLVRDAMGHWAARLTDGSEVRIGRSYVADVKAIAARG
ncbi:LytR/AlgR family response regulator transcription factor [Allosphingosinicella indica]|uniref:Two component transcriptional regulator, LytTR family n=1 Tax=Allosphingosinicella indica TaxID=941907 RepID=A0A1X7FZE3_9SPHN|nr:LytTR family DNA-binding domain-containing protein [Allosphingosinicella indica]SMF61439.1 two component transcriptional regulator, LytTR family [Allosphingosinicella indica]